MTFDCIIAMASGNSFAALADNDDEVPNQASKKKVGSLGMPRSTFNHNDRVEALWSEDGKWYPAQVLKVKGNGMFIIRFDGFPEKHNYQADLMRVPTKGDAGVGGGNGRIVSMHRNIFNVEDAVGGTFRRPKANKIIKGTFMDLQELREKIRSEFIVASFDGVGDIEIFDEEKNMWQDLVSIDLADRLSRKSIAKLRWCVLVCCLLPHPSCFVMLAVQVPPHRRQSVLARS